MHHRSHDQRGLCPGGLCQGLYPGGFVQEGVCPGGSLLGRPPHHSNEWAVRILLECILVRRLLVNREVGWGGMGFSISCIHCQLQRRRFNHVVLADEHQMKLISTSLKV